MTINFECIVDINRSDMRLNVKMQDGQRLQSRDVEVTATTPCISRQAGNLLTELLEYWLTTTNQEVNE